VNKGTGGRIKEVGNAVLIEGGFREKKAVRKNSSQVRKNRKADGERKKQRPQMQNLKRQMKKRSVLRKLTARPAHPSGKIG